VPRAAGETGTLQGNIQDWLQLDGGNSGFQLLTEEENTEISVVIFLSLFSSALSILLNISFIYFLSLFVFYEYLLHH
jgi:hypothetical protein